MRVSEHYLRVHAFKYNYTKEQTTFISETIGEYKEKQEDAKGKLQSDIQCTFC